jgi:carbamoyl-phosphate synthase large subunit
MARILRDIMADIHLVGTEIHDDHPAQAYFDKVLPVLRADDSGYQLCLQDIVRKYNIDLIIPSTEAEIGFFVEQGKIDDIFNVPVLIANESMVKTGLDKYKTSEYLKKIGVLSPWTVWLGQGKPVSFPCIIKPRVGCGSKNIAVVQEETYSQYSDFGDKYIWQEYLYPDNEEYTCGVFRSSSGEIRTITIKRQLQGGLTGKGVVVEDKSIRELLEKLADESGLIGSINAQLRLTAKGPVIFEINPRFSSTVMFRHKMGFQDLLWSLEDKFNLQLSTYSVPVEGTRLYRVSNEVILNA